MLALIEKRFLSTAGNYDAASAHLTLRDQYASTLEDMFDSASLISEYCGASHLPPVAKGDTQLLGSRRQLF
jgi:hypothetical protein